MTRAVITGASGFVGSRLCSALREKDMQVRAVVRPSSVIADQPDLEIAIIDDMGPLTDWDDVLDGVDVVFHIAARAHIMNETHDSPLEEYRRINVIGTRRLAEAAVNKRVKRIVYLSTIKVNGEITQERPFTEYDVPSPKGPYAVSKYDAEECLRETAIQHDIELVIIRSPLVYGPGVKGNLLNLLEQIRRGIPLPLGGIMNRRSLISLDNLVDALILSGTDAKCAGQTFLVSDGHDLSTTELVRMMASAMGRKVRLLPFPKLFFSLASKLVPSLKSLSDRLAGSLVVDSSKFREMLKWSPPQSVAAGMESMVAHFLAKKNES
jgi:nucleoside-diphosphate-sugar epimerase